MRWLVAILCGCGSPAMVVPDAAPPPPAYPHDAQLAARVAKDQGAFGAAIAISGDGLTLAVGMPRDDSGQTGCASDGHDDSAPDAGSVYIYTSGASGWTVQAYVKPDVTGVADQFGSSLGLSTLGDTLVVGAPGEGSGAIGDPNDNTASGAGAAYVFERHGTQWQQQAYLKAANVEGGDEFGLAVAISGDGNTVAIGAPGEDSIDTDPASNAAMDAGAAYTFTTDGTTWSQTAYVKAATPAPMKAFGSAVALDADGATLAVGAVDTAYIFHGGMQVTQLEESAGDSFGAALALSGLGTTLVVGAPLEGGHGNAYVFELGTMWAQRAQLGSASAGDRLGTAVAISGDGMLAAASAPGEAAAHVYANGESTALQMAMPMPSSHFGSSVALSSSGSILAVGAALDPSGGAVYLYY